MIHALFLCGTLLLTSCEKSRETSGKAFGTSWTLKASAAEVFQKALQTDLDRSESLISHWRADSAVSRFNASTSTDWQSMPSEVIELVQLAKRIADDTDGALDITLAPLIDLWGFGAQGSRQAPPTDAEIEKARQQCGWHLLEIRDQPPALRKRRMEVRINLSAVAEGLALDQLAKRLAAAQVQDFLLEFGGEVLARGRGPDGMPWLVAVQMPESSTHEPMQALRLENASLATSGTYRQHFEHEGKSYPHVLDPRTGRPVAHALRSVSVKHASAALADGYATALLVLGPEKGRAVAARLKLNVLWME
ncbi:MAG: FAD:protein FMN transferase [Verrucomicrobiaceae bacterium]|nr:FAD:protein FMN transferase [Verrucomicrobiaceae bacterium]